MANLVVKLGSLDLSNYVRVNPQDKMDVADGSMIEPAFSDSPLFEGQILTSLHIKNKEIKVPLFLHPQTAPYTQDPLNNLIQAVNQALRPVSDLGLTVYFQMQLAQASNPTFFTVQFGRFEPDFNFRQTEKGWFAGVLHLWCMPYGHTATERNIGTYSAPAMQSGLQISPATMSALASQSWSSGGVDGDVTPQFDIRVKTGSQVGQDGRLAVIAALPMASYNAIVPPASFVLNTGSLALYGGSGAWASQFLAFDTTGSQAAATQVVPAYFCYGQNFSAYLSPGSVYAGENRVLGLVRSRYLPQALRAFDLGGNPLGPTVCATSMDGYQLVDYGVLRVAPWQATVGITIVGYPAIGDQAKNQSIYMAASGLFMPQRTGAAWTKEHGPLFVVPNDSTILDLDFSSQLLGYDGFNNSGTSIMPDCLGNSYTYFGASNYAYATVSGGAFTNTVLAMTNNNNANFYLKGTAVNPAVQGFDVEGIFYVPVKTVGTIGANSATSLNMQVGVGDPSSGLGYEVILQQIAGGTQITFQASGTSVALATLMSGYYHMRIGQLGATMTGQLWGPSGAHANFASGAPITVAAAQVQVPTNLYPFFSLQTGAGGTAAISAFRARTVATGMQGGDIFHLNQPVYTNTRMQGSNDVADLQARMRGPISAINLPVPSLGSGLFVMAMPFDQGPANDGLQVDVRVRERFTYAR